MKNTENEKALSSEIKKILREQDKKHDKKLKTVKNGLSVKHNEKSKSMERKLEELNERIKYLEGKSVEDFSPSINNLKNEIEKQRLFYKTEICGPM